MPERPRPTLKTLWCSPTTPAVNADRLSWTRINDELLVKLRILNGRDTDLAADATRTVNRLRDALLALSPALERAIGDKLVTNQGLRDVLVSWPTPTALKTAGRSRIANRIAKNSPRTAQRLTDAITEALDAQSHHSHSRNRLGRHHL